MNTQRRRVWLKPLLAIVALVILTLIWRALVHLGLLDNESIQGWLTNLREYPRLLILAYLTGIFVVLLQAFFPLTLLVIATGALFGPVWGSVYATLATLSGSATSYWVGYWVGEEALRRLQSERIARAASYMNARSMRTMIIINILPIAPFTLTNMLAGSVRMPFARYMLGSAIGIIPGLVAVTVFGAQLSDLLVAQSPREWLVAALIGLLAITGFVVLHRVIRARRRAPP